jgi:hypothetical protein
MTSGPSLIKAVPIPISWDADMPVFARESFLKAVGDEYGWLGAFSESGELRGVLPYTVVRRSILRLVRFRVETIPLGPGLDPLEERAFLTEALDHFRALKADMIIPASNNALFRTFPDGADAAPYGSYVIDLTRDEEALWRGIDRIVRQNINSARKKGVTVLDGSRRIEAGYELVAETFRRSKLPFMSGRSFRRYLEGLGDGGLTLMAEAGGILQSYVVFGYSRSCAYAIYAGNLRNQVQGANKLIYWEAIQRFRRLGVRRYDFMGARVDPAPGSKQDEINLFKKRFGAELKQGFMWKYAFHPWRSRLYQLAARFRSGGDIVDAERRKLRPPFPPSGTAGGEEGPHAS